jgi:spermidine synthase
MGMEILAGRLIAPAFGSSIFTWGSIIGVFLAALSAGYYYGGKRSAAASQRALAKVFLATTAYVAFVILAGDFVVRAGLGVPVPPRFAPLVPVTVLFGPPVYLLGFVSPYAAALSERGTVGEVAGDVYALGTIGSIVGAFGTTFLLVPYLPVSWVGGLFGALQVAAALALVGPRPSRRGAASALLVCTLLVGATAVGSLGPNPTGDRVYSTQTAYQGLIVVDDDGVRTLYLDGHRHSAMPLDDPNDHVFTYTRYFHLPLLLRDDPDIDRALFVGGGGFTGPKAFVDRYDVRVDTVELDPEVVRVAKEYFAVEEGPNHSITVGDGRQFLRSTDRTYDVIVLDAYRQDKVPFHMTTVEFFELVRERLAPDGVVVANTIGAPTGSGSEFVRAEYRTIQRVFPQVYAVPTTDGGSVQNVELMATTSAERVDRETLRERAANRDVGVRLGDAVDRFRTDLPTGGVPTLTDDRGEELRLLDPLAGSKYVIEENGTGERAATALPAAPTLGGPNGPGGSAPLHERTAAV